MTLTIHRGRTFAKYCVDILQLLLLHCSCLSVYEGSGKGCDIPSQVIKSWSVLKCSWRCAPPPLRSVSLHNRFRIMAPGFMSGEDVCIDVHVHQTQIDSGRRPVGCRCVNKQTHLLARAQRGGEKQPPNTQACEELSPRIFWAFCLWLLFHTQDGTKNICRQ